MLTTTLALAIAAATGNGLVAANYTTETTVQQQQRILISGPVQGPKIVIDRIKAIDNLDGNFLQPDRADFYALVMVDGVEYKTRVLSKDDGFPRWEIPLPRTSARTEVRIRVMDDDGGLFEKSDDHVDVSKGADKKDVIFTIMPNGSIYGDINGQVGQSFYCKGDYDGDKGQLWFSVL